jgi:F0F1-type ATP synthase assembly protein I
VAQVRRKRPILRLGLMVGLALVFLLGLGIWLDRRLGTTPLFVLVGALLGILAATAGAVRVVGREIEALGRSPEAASVSGESQVERKEDTA